MLIADIIGIAVFAAIMGALVLAYRAIMNRIIANDRAADIAATRRTVSPFLVIGAHNRPGEN